MLRQPNWVGWRMSPFLGGKPPGAFGQPVFFLAGNRMTIVAFEKEVFSFKLSETVSLCMFLNRISRSFSE